MALARTSQYLIDLSALMDGLFLQLSCNFAQTDSRDNTAEDTNLQVFGNWVGRSMGYQENGIGFTDQAMPSFNETSMPVSHSCPHHGHPQLRVVGMIYFPRKTWSQFSSGKIWVPKCLSVTCHVCQRADCLLKWRCYCIQWHWNVQPCLERGRDVVHEDTSYMRTWVVVKEDEWPANREIWTPGLENAKLWHSTLFWHKQNPDLTLQPRQHQLQTLNEVPNLRM